MITKEPAKKVGADTMSANIKKSDNSRGTYVNRDLVTLLKKAIGSRSIIEFTNQCGLSISFVSRLLNNNLPSKPSKRSFLKMAKHLNNGVTIMQLLEVAGYSVDYEYEKALEHETLNEFSPCMRAFAEGPSYAMSLLVNVLVVKKLLIMPLNISLQPGLFEIESKVDGRCIVGLPAICGNDENDIEAVVQKTNLSFIMALDLYHSQKRDVCFVLITNQNAVMEAFGKNFHSANGFDVYAVMTSDYCSFSDEKHICFRSDEEKCGLNKFHFV